MEGSRSHPVDEECMASATSGDTSLGAQPRLVDSGGDEECMAFATSSEVNGSRSHSSSSSLAQGLANKWGLAEDLEDLPGLSFGTISASPASRCEKRYTAWKPSIHGWTSCELTESCNDTPCPPVLPIETTEEDLGPEVTMYYNFSGGERDVPGSFIAECRSLNAKMVAYDTLIDEERHFGLQPHVWKTLLGELKTTTDGSP